MIGTVLYLADESGPPVYVASVAGADAALGLEGTHVNHDVPIENGREDGPFHIDVHGFELRTIPSVVADYFDDDEIETTYRTEVEALVKQATGAARAHMFDHTRRGDSVALRDTKTMREPSTVIHCDYTERSGPQRVRDIMGDEANALLQNRFAIVNVWRPLLHPAQTSLLALCDARSHAPQDLVATERVAADRIGEIYLAHFNKNHRWVCFPNMTPDEALLIKTFDSAVDGRARLTLHTAFDNPDAPIDAKPRESIEARCFAFF